MAAPISISENRNLKISKSMGSANVFLELKLEADQNGDITAEIVDSGGDKDSWDLKTELKPISERR